MTFCGAKHRSYQFITLTILVVPNEIEAFILTDGIGPFWHLSHKLLFLDDQSLGWSARPSRTSSKRQEPFEEIDLRLGIASKVQSRLVQRRNFQKIRVNSTLRV